VREKTRERRFQRKEVVLSIRVGGKIRDSKDKPRGGNGTDGGTITGSVDSKSVDSRTERSEDLGRCAE